MDSKDRRLNPQIKGSGGVTMYVVELSGLVWQYNTAEEVWNTNKALEARKNCPPITGSIGTVWGVRQFEEFKRLLDEGKVLQYHALKVYKVE